MVSTWTPESAIPEDLKADLKTITATNYILVFLQIISLLKKQRRTGWVEQNIQNCESISDHMYRMSIISNLLPEKVEDITNEGSKIVQLNKSRCVQIAVVHDMAESLVGDITPKDTKIDKNEKHHRELETMKFLCNHLIKPYNESAAELILQLWLEYENISTIEARYVKDIDKFEMILQAFEYEKDFQSNSSVNVQGLNSFYDAVASIKTKEIKELAAEVMRQRSEFWKSIE